MKGYGQEKQSSKLISNGIYIEISNNIGDKICKLKEVKPIFIEKWKNEVEFFEEGLDAFFGIKFIFKIDTNVYLKKIITLGFIFEDEIHYYKPYEKQFHLIIIK